MRPSEIEDYINGLLSQEERIQFELRMQKDVKLNQEVRLMEKIIADFQYGALSHKITKIQAQRKSNKNLWVKPAIILFLSSLLVLLIWFLWPKKDVILNPQDPESPVHSESDTTDTTMPDQKQIQNTPDIKNDSNKEFRDKGHKPKSKIPTKPVLAFKDKKQRDLAMNYYTIPDKFAYLRSESFDTKLDSAKFFLNNEQMEEGLEILNSIPNPDYDIQFFKAQFYFKSGKFVNAGASLDKAKAGTSNPAELEEIEWYQLLNSVACGNQCAANQNKYLVQILQNKRHTYFERAVKLQASLLK